MRLKALKLENFRNFEQKEFRFSDITVITGVNASGKTTIAEAINLISTGKLLRGDYDKEAISFDKDFVRVTAEVGSNEGEFKLEALITTTDKASNRSQKRFKVNGVLKLQKNFIGRLKSVLFTPEDLKLLANGPSERRREIDTVLSQISMTYHRSISDLSKIIKNRNKILEKIREERTGFSELTFWNEKLILEAASIHKTRSHYMQKIAPKLLEIGRVLDSQNTQLTIVYEKSEVTEERLEKVRDREIGSKMTLIGPTRDDFKILLNQKDVDNFGSRGQQRTAILALKMCELGFFEEETAEKPVLILDDIMSELDEQHREHVLEITPNQQTILTTTNKNFPSKLPKAVELGI